ncbi:LysR family transcriptional regulator [Micromonospora vulcania]
MSLHVAQLRKEFGDKLFRKTAAGLAFTPGGLRLASRAAEMLGLQDRTMLEVSAASRGRRLLRVAASSMFAEFAAPGLIELFAKRAADLDVELSVRNPSSFDSLLVTRAADISIGPQPPVLDKAICCRPMMNYRLVLVVGPDHPLAGVSASPGQLRDQTWLLGPSAAADLGAVPALLRRLAVPEERQQIFQSHAAALGEVKRGRGISPVLSFTVAPDVREGQLQQVAGPHATVEAVWHSQVLAGPGASSAAAELARFSSTPRAIQAMMRGAGVSIGHFRPSVHVTLWS